ncbi:MAG TPA: GNAT family N-acetyltransferase [Lysobacter sp.]|nr:GNAT family N-acetyltransferase [Lysobacter sp.]
MTHSSAPAAAMAIEHENDRFVASVDGIQARLDYRLEGERMVISHTEVPEAIAGRGIAGKLTRAAFEHARAQGWLVRPACAYAAGWAERHPEYGSLLA